MPLSVQFDSATNVAIAILPHHAGAKGRPEWAGLALGTPRRQGDAFADPRLGSGPTVALPTNPGGARLGTVRAVRRSAPGVRDPRAALLRLPEGAQAAQETEVSSDSMTGEPPVAWGHVSGGSLTGPATHR